MIGDHSSHWEGGLELGDVHIAIRRGERSQAACDAGKKKGSVSRGHLCTPERQSTICLSVSPTENAAWPPRTAHLGLKCSDLLICVPLLFLKQAFACIVASGIERVRRVGKQ